VWLRSRLLGFVFHEDGDYSSRHRRSISRCRVLRVGCVVAIDSASIKGSPRRTNAFASTLRSGHVRDTSPREADRSTDALVCMASGIRMRLSGEWVYEYTIGDYGAIKRNISSPDGCRRNTP